MDSNAPITHALIDAVHRRIVMLRILESLAVGCAAASLAGLLLLPIVWWRGRSSLGMAEALLGMGAVCGLIRGLAARPTRLDAAAEADRQLHLHDLLGTVLSLDGAGDGDLTTPQWRQSLLAISEMRCRDLRASAVITNRLGLRSWGGVGVLVGGQMTLSLLCAQTPDLRASAHLDAIAAPIQSASQAAQSVIDRASESPARPPGGGGADQDFHRDDAPLVPSPDPTDSSASTDHATNGRSGKGDVGSGLAHTPDRIRADLGADHAGNSAIPGGRSIVGAGIADQSARGAATSDRSAASAGTGAPAARIAPWQAVDGMADSAAADAAIRAGRVPDSAADLVRDYFQRD